MAESSGSLVRLSNRPRWFRWTFLAAMFSAGGAVTYWVDGPLIHVWDDYWQVPQRIRGAGVAARWPEMAAKTSVASLFVPTWLYSAVIGVVVGRLLRKDGLGGAIACAAGIVLIPEIRSLDVDVYFHATMPPGGFAYFIVTKVMVDAVTILLVVLPAWLMRRSYLARRQRRGFPVTTP